MALTRIQLELPEDKVKQIEALMEESGLKTKKDYINNALTLLEWAMREVKSGGAIASVDEREKRYKEILLPALENITVRQILSTVETPGVEARQLRV